MHGLLRSILNWPIAEEGWCCWWWRWRWWIWAAGAQIFLPQWEFLHSQGLCLLKCLYVTDCIFSRRVFEDVLHPSWPAATAGGQRGFIKDGVTFLRLKQLIEMFVLLITAYHFNVGIHSRRAVGLCWAALINECLSAFCSSQPRIHGVEHLQWCCHKLMFSLCLYCRPQLRQTRSAAAFQPRCFSRCVSAACFSRCVSAAVVQPRCFSRCISAAGVQPRCFSRGVSASQLL